MERPNRSAIEQRPFETFLKACFQPDEILSFAPGTILEGEARAIPEHSGINVFTRDQWLERADAKGDIERLVSTRHGLYLRINPVTHKSNGSDQVRSEPHCAFVTSYWPMLNTLTVTLTTGTSRIASTLSPI